MNLEQVKYWGSIAGALMALIILFKAITPDDQYLATRGWVHEYADGSIQRSEKMFVNDLRRSISHYNKQICFGRHTEEDIHELQEALKDYRVSTGALHPFASQSQADICYKLRIKFRQ